MNALQTCRFLLRSLTRKPGHAVAVILTLALGIGGSCTIFSFVYGVLLQPLDYPQSARLVVVGETNPQRSGDWLGASPANHADWARQSNTIEAFGMARSWAHLVTWGEQKFNVESGVATPGLFEVFSVNPHLGRRFGEAQTRSGGERVVLLSHDLWQGAFGGDANVVGQMIRLDGEPHEIIGVLPADFHLPELQGIELWIPLWPERYAYRDWRGLYSYGRLAPGSTVKEAQAEMDLIADDLAKAYPDANAGWRVRVMPLKSRLVESVRGELLVFFVGVGLLLLIGCANVANLLLARATNRSTEFAVRAALGAGAGRLMGLVLAEGLLLALAGCGLGLLASFWAVELVAALAPPDLPRLEEVGVNGWVALFAVVTALLTSLVYGAAPAWQASRPNLMKGLRTGSASGAHARGGAAGGLRQGLVVAQVAMATVLLIGAGLLVRTYVNYLDWQPGFKRDGLVTMFAVISSEKYPTALQSTGFHRRAIEALQSIPSVESAGGASAGPLFGGGDGTIEFAIEGAPMPPEGAFPAVDWYDVSPTYFRTMGIELKQGRSFEDTDHLAAPRVCIVNESFARRYFEDGPALGQRLRLIKRKVKLEIVGVVADVEPFEPGTPVKPELYWPIYQFPRLGIQYVARTAGPPGPIIPMLRSRLQELDPDISLGAARTMREHVARELVQPRFNLTLLGLFAITAICIAAIGVYGMVSFAVAQRTREIGVRMALGASQGSILKLMLGGGLRLCILGVVLGCLAGLGLNRLMVSLLANVSPADPISFSGGVVVLIALAALACIIPARRAAKVDPMMALRYE